VNLFKSFQPMAAYPTCREYYGACSALIFQRVKET